MNSYFDTNNPKIIKLEEQTVGAGFGLYASDFWPH